MVRMTDARAASEVDGPAADAPGKSKAEPTRRLITIMLVLTEVGSIGIGPVALADAVGFGDELDEKSKKDQVSRDIRMLRGRGHVIENVAEEGMDARYVLRPGDDRFRLQLTEEQQLELRRADLLTRYSNTDSDGSAIGEPGTELDPALDLPAPPTELDNLMVALRSRSLVRFSYSGKDRVVHPAAVRPLQRGWVLFGWEEASQRVKNYSVGKMSGLTLDRPGSATRVVPAEDLVEWPLAWKVDAPTPAQLQVPEEYQPDVERLLGPAEYVDRSGEVAVLSYTVTNRRVFLARVFELGFRVRLVGGEQMRQEARRVLEEAVQS